MTTPLPFYEAFHLIPFDGNIGVYANGDPVEPDTPTLTADRREYPRECQGFTFLCDGIDCGAFRAATPWTVDPVLLAEEFLTELEMA